MTDTKTKPEAYERALAAEPQLRAIEAMVDALVALAPNDQPYCTACIWETILKPLVSPWVGWERGDVPEQAKDEPPGLELIGLGELLARGGRARLLERHAAAVPHGCV
jgi:hypothetical protein